MSLNILQHILINNWKYSCVYIFLDNTAVDIFTYRSLNIYVKAFVCNIKLLTIEVILIYNSTSRVYLILLIVLVVLITISIKCIKSPLGSEKTKHNVQDPNNK